jgi:MraZ protein
MFIGEYQHSVDSKGRVAIPSKFRDSLRSGAVVTRGIDQNLTIYPKGEWEKLASKLSELPTAQTNVRAYVRLMLSGAMDAELDGQGRVILPGYLRDYGKIKTNVVITGLFNRLEVWDQTAWKAYKQKAEKASPKIAEGLTNLGV